MRSPTAVGNVRRVAIALALACALPAMAQPYGSSSSAITRVNGDTRVTGTAIDTSAAAATATTDRQLLSDVVTSLAADPRLDGASIEVQVSEGRVTLSGVARDTTQSEAARSIADTVAGSPANVTNRITTGG